MSVSAARPKDLPRAHRKVRSKPLYEAAHILWSAADDYARRQLLCALALVSAGALITALTPVALKYVVDTISVPGDATTFASLAILLLYVLGQYLSRCTTELRLLAHGYAEQRLRCRISARLFAHLVRLPMKFHLDRKAGALAETAEQGMRGFQLLLQHLVSNFVPVVIELGVVAAVLLGNDRAKYLVIVGAAAIAYVIAFHRGAIVIRDSAEVVATSHISAHGLMTDALVNQETIKYFDAEGIVSSRYEAALSQTESAWRRFLRKRTGNGLLVAGIFGISLGASLVCAARDISHGQMTLGDFVLVHAYILRLVQPLEMVGYAIRDIAQGVAFLGSMIAVFREKSELDSLQNTNNVQSAAGELALRTVSFRYRNERPVLKDVTFTVPAGKTFAVVGVSGSGKSSLIRLLFRLYEPDGGEILLDGVPIRQMPLSAVRREIAIVPQDTVLLHDTIARNIGFGRFGASQYEIEQAARIANLHEFIIGLPEGYETVVGERGLKLSGGERQRVAIARAALKRPRIFVFDEATSSLDSKTEREILRNLIDLSTHSTTLVIAHRLSTVVYADEIVVLSEGTVVERGSHSQLLAMNGHYAALWHAQQSGSHAALSAAS
jgi:ABC-type transport system involved in Fe-S cluster assembly fused permease/ATPase subunit